MIDPALIRELAGFAQIDLAPGEDLAIAADLARTMEHLAPLLDLPAEPDDAARDEWPGGAGPVLRPDTPGADPLLLPLSSIAPRWADGMFIVPTPTGLNPGE